MNARHVFLLLLLPASSALSQSADSLVQEALSNNPQVAAYDYRIRASDSRATSAGAWPAPAIGVELSQVPTTGGNPFSSAISNNFSISQMFMLGGKLSAMSDVEKKRSRLLEENRAAFRVDLRGRVKMNYYRLWLLDRQIEVGERTVSTLRDLVNAMRWKVVTNRVAQADLLSIQAEAAATEASLGDKRAERRGLLNTLNALLGRDDVHQEVRTVSMPAAAALRWSGQELSERVADRNPALLAMDRMAEMNEAMIEAAEKELIPDLMVQAMVMRMPNGMILTSGPRSAEAIQHSAMGMPMQKEEWMYSIMASITLPFVPWASGRSTGKTDEMHATNLGIAAERDAMQREMTAALHSALTTYAAKDSLAREYQASILPLARQSAEAQTLAYQNGTVPVTAVLDARRMELMREDEFFMVIMDREMALIQAEMMTGESL
ncbi:MAG: TolC family protein [Bacteroidetes bacterium]|nr:TolC family protein [Bacteroidota bacterium]